MGCSAIGVTAGLVEYVIAVALTLMVLLALYALHRLPTSSDQYFSSHLKWTGDLGLLKEVTDQLIQDRVYIKSRRVVRQPKTGECRVALGLRMRKMEHDYGFLDRLQADERFDEVDWN